MILTGLGTLFLLTFWKYTNFPPSYLIKWHYPVSIFKATGVYHMCTIPAQVRSGGAGIMPQNYTIRWKIHLYHEAPTSNTRQQTGKIPPASSGDAHLHFWGEMADGYHIGSEMGRRELHPLGTNPQETWLFTYNAQGTIYVYRQKRAGWKSAGQS